MEGGEDKFLCRIVFVGEVDEHFAVRYVMPAPLEKANADAAATGHGIGPMPLGP